MSSRPRIPEHIRTAVLSACAQICCICYYLNENSKSRPVPGQIAHLDENSANNKPENLVWLCPTHHTEYDKKSNTVQHLPAGMVRTWRNNLVNLVAERRKNLDAAFLNTALDEVRAKLTAESTFPLNEPTSTEPPAQTSRPDTDLFYHWGVGRALGEAYALSVIQDTEAKVLSAAKALQPHPPVLSESPILEPDEVALELGAARDIADMLLVPPQLVDRIRGVHETARAQNIKATQIIDLKNQLLSFFKYRYAANGCATAFIIGFHSFVMLHILRYTLSPQTLQIPLTRLNQDLGRLPAAHHPLPELVLKALQEVALASKNPSSLSRDAGGPILRVVAHYNALGSFDMS